MLTTLFIDFFRRSRTTNSVMGSGRNSNSSKLLWLSLLPAGMMKIHLKRKLQECSQHFSHYKYMGIYPDVQGKLIPQSLVVSCWISNPFEILWLYSLPIRMKNIQSKMEELEYSRDFPHYNPIEAICRHKPEFWSDLAENLMQPFPHPNGTPDEIWFQ